MTARKERGVCLLGTPPCHPATQSQKGQPRLCVGAKGRRSLQAPAGCPQGLRHVTQGTEDACRCSWLGRGGAPWER